MDRAGIKGDKLVWTKALNASFDRTPTPLEVVLFTLGGGRRGRRQNQILQSVGGCAVRREQSGRSKNIAPRRFEIYLSLELEYE
jgi:hypothetical protein